MGSGSRGTYDEATWGPDFARAGGQSGAPRPYRAFIPDRIADLDPTLSAATSALSERAGSAVRELNASGSTLAPLEGLARQLLRSEALASSRIEGLSISHRKLAQAAIEGQGSHRALEVLATMRAMEAAVQIGAGDDEVTRESILEIHRALAIVPPLDRIAGQLRTEQGWIGGADPPDADYVGPPHQHVPKLIDDLCQFVNRDDISPVAQAAIAHAQFELIHPFGDGNGRAGRCLIHVLFRRRGLALRYVPPVSLVFGANKDAYIAGLENFREGRIDEWTAQFARAVEMSASRADRFSRRVNELQAEWMERAGPLRKDAAARAIIGNLPSFPFMTTKVVQDLTGRSDVAALKGLDRLEKAGILTRHRNRRKGDSWEAKELLAVLDEFEHAVRMPSQRCADHSSPRAAIP
jgi:Fic family protein